MNRIRLLPDHVANQIAAGEVVERPASVVKELVENALDAESTRIQVEIAAGGRSLIRVTDDGTGMGRDDALLCLERHATSKIRSAEDLASIQTMGFRGEALPSIASVCRFVLTTRERSDTSGEANQLIIQGGKLAEVKAAASPPGTTVEVRQLFFNLPARRKFLRSDETERAHIQHYLTLAALSHPRVGFTFISDGRIVWQLPPLAFNSEAERGAALQERLRQLHGADTPLLAVDFHAQLEPDDEPHDGPHDGPGDGPGGGAVTGAGRGGFRVWGFIGAPGVSRATRDEQHLFVNRRPVENRGLNFALVEGYHNVLMKGRYPVCCLFIEIDPAAVDVNIHPSKREVKFRNEGLVRRWVGDAVRAALQKFHAATPEKPSDQPTQPDAASQPDGLRATPFQLQPTPTPEPAPEQAPLPLGFRPDAAASPTRFEPSSLPSRTIPATAIPPSQAVSAPPLSPPLPPAASTTENPSGTPGRPNPPSFPSGPREPAPGLPTPLLRVPLKVVGIIGRLYVVLESDRGLVLMDQHAAHERVLYEQMLRRMEESGQAPQQRLLLPETVELSVRDAEFVRQNLATLARLGVGLTEFGDRTFLLDGLPPFFRGSTPKQFAVSLIDELKAAGSGINTLRLGEDVIAKTVCRHSVKANDPLQGPEIEALLRDLRACSMPYTCPHGRPTLVEMSWRELEKKFGRTG